MRQLLWITRHGRAWRRRRRRRRTPVEPPVPANQGAANSAAGKCFLRAAPAARKTGEAPGTGRTPARSSCPRVPTRPLPAPPHRGARAFAAPLQSTGEAQGLSPKGQGWRRRRRAAKGCQCVCGQRSGAHIAEARRAAASQPGASLPPSASSRKSVEKGGRGWGAGKRPPRASAGAVQGPLPSIKRQAPPSPSPRPDLLISRSGGGPGPLSHRPARHPGRQEGETAAGAWPGPAAASKPFHTRTVHASPPAWEAPRTRLSHTGEREIRGISARRRRPAPPPPAPGSRRRAPAARAAGPPPRRRHRLRRPAPPPAARP